MSKPTGEGRGRTLRTALTVGALTTALLGCPLKSKDDAPPPVVDAGATAQPTGAAKNEGQITRYPNETILGGVPAVIGKDGTIARTFPGAGGQVAVLAKATPCGKVAQNGNAGTLITWNDPADGAALMGWVPNDAFQGTVPSIKPVIVPKDSGAPAVQDAGAPTPPPADAGAPQGDPCPVSCPAINNQCPAGKKNDNGMCRKPCKQDSECPRNVKCQARGVCSSA